MKNNETSQIRLSEKKWFFKKGPGIFIVKILAYHIKLFSTHLPKIYQILPSLPI